MTEERKKLVTENLALAHYVANRFRSNAVEYEEIISTAYLGLVKAAVNYDFDKEIRFSTFAIKVIHNEILYYLRRTRKHVAISLNALVLPDEDITLEDVIQDKRNLFKFAEDRFDIEKQMETLRAAEQRVFYLKMQEPDITQTELGRRLGFSQSYVARLLKSGKKKLLV